MHARKCKGVCVRVQMPVQTCACTCARIHSCKCVRVCLCVPVRKCTRVRVRGCLRVHSLVHVHTCVSVCVCVSCYGVSPEEATHSANIKCLANAPCRGGEEAASLGRRTSVREPFLPVILGLAHRWGLGAGRQGSSQKELHAFCLFGFPAR